MLLIFLNDQAQVEFYSSSLLGYAESHDEEMMYKNLQFEKKSMQNTATTM
jgi:hypothetical protein